MKWSFTYGISNIVNNLLSHCFSAKESTGCVPVLYIMVNMGSGCSE